MSVRAAASRKKDWREAQRRRRFRQYYLQTSDAKNSAIQAGYSEMTAATHGFRMAAACEETLRDQCDYLGLTHLALVQCLKRTLNAKEPRWNAKREAWDLFENTTAQLAAYDRLKEIIEPEVPKFKNPNIKVGVAVQAGAANQAAWVEQYGSKGQTGSSRVTVTVETEDAGEPGNGNGHNGHGRSGSVRPALAPPDGTPDGGD